MPNQVIRGSQTIDFPSFSIKNLFAVNQLPPNIEELVPKRLKIMAILPMVAFLVASGAIAFLTIFTEQDRLVFLRFLSSFFFFVVAVVVYKLVDSPKVNVHTLATIFFLTGMVVVPFSSYVVPFPEGFEPRDTMPQSALWLMLFPIIVPCTPKVALYRGLVGVVLAVSVLSLTVIAFSYPTPTLNVWFNLIWGHLAATFIALIPVCTFHQLGVKIEREKQMGSYEIGEKLGEGGMGAVYRARHRMLKRPAAIKLILPDRTADSQKREKRLKRFTQEAKATSLLHSPHSIELYDFGVTNQGTFFFVMEMLDGYDMEKLIKEWGVITVERAIYLLLQVCDSLADAHYSGLIHRDIKPANIMVCRYGNKFDFVKVLDFGIAKKHYEEEVLTEEALSTTIHHDLTQAGAILGTPVFMPPEIFQKQQADTKYDIYAFGCIAYWLLTGRFVFEVHSIQQLIYAHVSKTPDPLSQVSPQEIPPEFEQIVMQCLEKDPQKRPPSMQEIAKALQKVPLAEPWDNDKAKAWWKSVKNSVSDEFVEEYDEQQESQEESAS